MQSLRGNFSAALLISVFLTAIAFSNEPLPAPSFTRVNFLRTFMAKGAACYETQGANHYGQFDTEGYPYCEVGDGGVGMMQITEGTTDPNIFWNWQANVDGGRSKLIEKWRLSKSWFRDRMDEHYPPPTCDEELFDTYCLYNGGHYYTADVNTHTYIRNTYWKNECGQCNPNNPEADRVANSRPEICKQSGCCYADDAMRRH